MLLPSFEFSVKSGAAVPTAAPLSTARPRGPGAGAAHPPPAPFPPAPPPAASMAIIANATIAPAMVHIRAAFFIVLPPMEFAQELQFYTFAMRGGTNILIGERIPVLPNGCFSIVRSVL